MGIWFVEVGLLLPASKSAATTSANPAKCNNLEQQKPTLSRCHIARQRKPIMKFSTAIVTILSAASVASGFVAAPNQCKFSFLHLFFFHARTHHAHTHDA